MAGEIPVCLVQINILEKEEKNLKKERSDYYNVSQRSTAGAW